MNASAAGMRYRSRCQAMPTMRGLTLASRLSRRPGRCGSTDSHEMMAAPTPAAARPRMVALSWDLKAMVPQPRAAEPVLDGVDLAHLRVGDQRHPGQVPQRDRRRPAG